MSAGPAFESAGSLKEAAALLAFEPIVPAETAGCTLDAIRVHVRDHKGRDVPSDDRTLELHYGDFVVSESRKGEAEARHWAIEVSYGQSFREILVAGRKGRAFDLGPEVPPDDIDGRSPAVVTWYDGELFFLVASGNMPAESLQRVAESMYAHGSLW